MLGFLLYIIPYFSVFFLILFLYNLFGKRIERILLFFSVLGGEKIGRQNMDEKINYRNYNAFNN